VWISYRNKAEIETKNDAEIAMSVMVVTESEGLELGLLPGPGLGVAGDGVCEEPGSEEVELGAAVSAMYVRMYRISQNALSKLLGGPRMLSAN